VSPQEAKILRGREYNAAKKSEKERASSGGKAKAKTGERPTVSAKGQNVPKQETGQRVSAELAEKHGVGEKTIRRDAVRAELHDAVQEADPKAAEKIASMPDKDVAEAMKPFRKCSYAITFDVLPASSKSRTVMRSRPVQAPLPGFSSLRNRHYSYLVDSIAGVGQRVQCNRNDQPHSSKCGDKVQRKIFRQLVAQLDQFR